MFGGALTLANETRDLVSNVGIPDVLVVSDMLDLASFLGHVGWDIGEPKIVLYMHENQLTYPLSPTARNDSAYAYMNWSSMVRADEVWFNSQFHLDSVFDSLHGFLKHFPDHRHGHLIPAVRDRPLIMPIGVELDWVRPFTKDDPPLIMWNQRWEYDKDPVRLFAAFDRLMKRGSNFRIALCGENFRNVPDEFETGSQRLGDRLIHYGYADRDLYEDLLHDSSVVVSTAKHEFFGIAAVEAMAAGAVPVFPNDLSYPELIPTELHHMTLYQSDDELDDLLSEAVESQQRRSQVRPVLEPAMSGFSWKNIASRYDDALTVL